MSFARALVSWSLAGLLVIPGCSSVDVSQDYDPATDFSKLRAYSWIEPTQGRADVDQLTAERIVRAVDAELQAKGFTKTPSNPDFLVNFLASVEQRIEARPTTVTVGYGWRHGYGGVSGTELETYDEGTLVIDFVEPSSRSLLWRGTAQAAVEARRTPEEREARIREVVAQVLAQFPPQRTP